MQEARFTADRICARRITFTPEAFLESLYRIVQYDKFEEIDLLRTGLIKAVIRSPRRREKNSPSE